MAESTPRLIVLDGHAMNPGDLNWAPLQALVQCEIHPRTAAEKVVGVCATATAVLTNKVVLDASTLNALPALRYIGVTATGVNVIDLAAASARGITVTNVPAYSTQSVAQATFAHILNLTQRTARHAVSVREGHWAQCPDFSYSLTPQIELAGKTIGLLGLGNIGLAVANIAAAFGMRVLASTPSKVGTTVDGIPVIPLADLLPQSDIISLHCPLAANNHQLINAIVLAQLKAGAFLINTSRGPLLDEAAVADALISGQLGGAGLDVLSAEPPPQDCPLYRAPNCFISPHNAWATRESRQRLIDVAVANFATFLSGTPQNVVSMPVQPRS